MPACIDVAHVDDDPIEHYLVQRAIERGGGKLCGLPLRVSAYPCLERIERMPDVLFLDLQIRGSRGYPTVQRARVHLPGVPIIVVSGVLDAYLGTAEGYVLKEANLHRFGHRLIDASATVLQSTLRVQGLYSTSSYPPPARSA